MLKSILTKNLLDVLKWCRKNGGVQYYVAPSNTSLRSSNWIDIEVSQISKEFNLPFENPKKSYILWKY